MPRVPYGLVLAATCNLCACVDRQATTSDATASPAGTSSGDATAGQGSTLMLHATSTGGSTSSGGPATTADGSTSATTGGSVCGDGVVDPGEECDDGNAVDNDGCLSGCVLGPGWALPPLLLPPLEEDENLRCFTAIDAALLDGEEHALVLGSEIFHVGIGGQVSAHVRRLPLADADPVAWTYLKDAGDFGRRPHRAITADNGDVIVVGIVYTEAVKPDSGGYSWRARFAPDGTLVWNHEDKAILVFASDIALTPQGDLVVAGNSHGFTSSPDLRVFGPDGALKATFWDSDVPGYSTWYSDIAVDEDGNIYVLGGRSAQDDTHDKVSLRGLSPDATLQWSMELSSPTHVYAGGSSLVLTADGVLLATIEQTNELLDWQSPGPLALAWFTTDGVHLGWKELSPPESWHPLNGALIADAEGGAYLASTLAQGEDRAVLVARLSPNGDPLWTNVGPGEPVWDVMLGPDGLFYVLTKNAIIPHLP